MAKKVTAWWLRRSVFVFVRNIFYILVAFLPVLHPVVKLHIFARNAIFWREVVKDFGNFLLLVTGYRRGFYRNVACVTKM